MNKLKIFGYQMIVFAAVMGFISFGSNLEAGCGVLIAGGQTSLAVGPGTTIWAWGSNTSGQIGNGLITPGYNLPQVITLPLPVEEVAAQDSTSLVLLNDGTVMAWGFGTDGNLGDGTFVTNPTPGFVRNSTNTANLSGVSSIEGGDNSCYALMNDATVLAWGLNSNGQLGNGNTGTNENLPVQVTGLTNVFVVSGGGNHALALKNDGTVWSWGKNDRGQLGNNSQVDSNIPVQVVGLGGSGFLQNIIAISAGSNFSVALRNDGTVWTWGDNFNGRLGIGPNLFNLFSATPVQVLDPTGSSFLTGITFISAGFDHVLTIKNDATSWAWGNNKRGQLGNGVSFTVERLPVQVGTPSLTQNWAFVSAGNEYSLGIKTDSSDYGWGNGLQGQIGIGSNPFALGTPTLIPTINISPGTCNPLVTLLPPSNLQGRVLKNNFLTQTDIIHRLSWTLSPSTTVAGYRIYLGATLVSQVGPNFVETILHNRVKGVMYTYTLVSFDSSGNQSSALTITLP